MNKKDIGLFTATMLGIAAAGAKLMQPFKYAKVAPTPYKRSTRNRGGGGSGMSGIATIQGIRIAENRKQRIKGKQRKAAKRLLLIKRKLKQESAIC